MLAAAPLEEDPASSHHSAPCLGLMCVCVRARACVAPTLAARCASVLYFEGTGVQTLMGPISMRQHGGQPVMARYP
jgi:hypothetical protein